jgi:hypothetical protein
LSIKEQVQSPTHPVFFVGSHCSMKQIGFHSGGQ